MRNILYFTVIFSKETLKQFVSFLPKKSLRILRKRMLYVFKAVLKVCELMQRIR